MKRSARKSTSKDVGAAYKASGVNIAAGDAFSTFCGEICRSTWSNNELVKVIDWSEGHFRGPRAFRIHGFPHVDTYQVSTADGIGSKTIPITACGNQYSAAHNLIAMTAGDITRFGGYPLIALNILDIASLGEVGDERYVAACSLMQGLKDVCDSQRYVLLGGETAELNVCVSSEIPDALTKFNWASVMIGMASPQMLITGRNLRPGQRIMALRDGIRSNGLSAARRYLRKAYGEEWWNNPCAKDAIESAAEPATLYDKFFVNAHGWTAEGDVSRPIRMHFIAHLSGGGVLSKFGDPLFRFGLSADLSWLFKPSMIMEAAVQGLEMSDLEAYSTFNGGQGALVVIDKEQEADFHNLAKAYGLSSAAVGKIRATRKCTGPRLRIVSQYTGKTFTYRSQK